MNVIQRPRAREFCATMQDYIIDTDVTITFCVKFGGQKILEEEYVPDAKNQVRVRRLGQFCALALWGDWPSQYHAIQSSAAGTFTFLINDVQDSTSYVIYSGLQTGKSATSPGALCEVTRKVTVPGVQEYVSGFLTGSYVLTGTDSQGAAKSVTVEVLQEQRGAAVHDIRLPQSGVRTAGGVGPAGLHRIVQRRLPSVPRGPVEVCRPARVPLQERV